MKECPNCQRATMLNNECIHCNYIEPTRPFPFDVLFVFLIFCGGSILGFALWQQQKVFVPPANQGVVVEKPQPAEPEHIEEINDNEVRLKHAIRIAMSEKTAQEIMQLRLLPEPELSKPVSFMSADGFYMEVKPDGTINGGDFASIVESLKDNK